MDRQYTAWSVDQRIHDDTGSKPGLLPSLQIVRPLAFRCASDVNNNTKLRPIVRSRGTSAYLMSLWRSLWPGWLSKKSLFGDFQYYSRSGRKNSDPRVCRISQTTQASKQIPLFFFFFFGSPNIFLTTAHFPNQMIRTNSSPPRNFNHSPLGSHT